ARSHARSHAHTHTHTHTHTHKHTPSYSHPVSLSYVYAQDWSGSTLSPTHTHTHKHTHPILFSPCISVICECSGLEWLHLLTSKKKYELRVDMEDFEGGTVPAQYTSSAVASEAEGYQLDVSGYIDGGAGRDGHTHTHTHTLSL